MTEVVFAQLCKTVSSVEEDKSKVLDLYGTASSETAKNISSTDFINLFYSVTESGDTTFNMNLDQVSLENCKTYLNLAEGWYEKNMGAMFQVAERVPSEYGNMMGIGMECFDTCSLMKLRSELLELEDLCNVCENKSVICCSLSLDELIDVLNDGGAVSSREKPSDGTLAVTTAADGSTSLTSGNNMLHTGDKLAFSVLITNPSSKVTDVELKLHFKILNVT